MHLLYFRHSGGEREYVVFTDDTTAPEDHAEPGFTLTAQCELDHFSQGFESQLPTDQPLKTVCSLDL